MVSMWKLKVLGEIIDNTCSKQSGRKGLSEQNAIYSGIKDSSSNVEHRRTKTLPRMVALTFNLNMQEAEKGGYNFKVSLAYKVNYRSFYSLTLSPEK